LGNNWIRGGFLLCRWWANDFVCGADLLGAGCFLVIKGGGVTIGDLLGGVGDLLGAGGGGGVA